MNFTYATAFFDGKPSLTLADLERAVAEIEKLKSPWTLISPDGRVWTSENPRDVMLALIREVPVGQLLANAPNHKE